MGTRGAQGVVLLKVRRGWVVSNGKVSFADNDKEYSCDDTNNNTQKFWSVMRPKERVCVLHTLGGFRNSPTVASFGKPPLRIIC